MTTNLCVTWGLGAMLAASTLLNIRACDNHPYPSGLPRVEPTVQEKGSRREEPRVQESDDNEGRTRSFQEKREGLADDYDLAMPAPRQDIAEQILRRTAYATSFNSTTNMPNWVAWCLTREHTHGSVQRSEARFHEDDDVDPRNRVTTYDYMRSGYDRGHMCPAGDNKWSYEAMTECFLMTNICPQVHSLNAGDWNEIEIKCRNWANRYGRIYIVSGPILFRSQHKRIGQQHKVTVPEAFFKVVLRMDDGDAQAIGFIYRNQDGNRPMGDYVNSVDEVERITGYDFFPQLPDELEERVEASASLKEWR